MSLSNRSRFGGLERLDAFLDRAGGHHAIDEHCTRLSDTMNAVHGLRLHRGVPPGIEQKNVVRRVQRDAGARGFERHEHGGGSVGILEALHGLEAVERHAGEFVAGEVGEGVREGVAHAVEQHHELREDDDLVPVGDDFGEAFDEERDFARVGQTRVLDPRQHVGVAADLAQSRKQGEQAEGFFSNGRAHVVAEALQALGTNAGVFGALHFGERGDKLHLDLGREFLRDFVLGAAEDEGASWVRRRCMVAA